MQRKVSFLLPIGVFEDIQTEALKYQISISDLIRERISRPERFKKDSSNTVVSPAQPTSQPPEENLINLEILFLLREFLFERNAQILKKVDERMEKRFGKDRKKII